MEVKTGFEVPLQYCTQLKALDLGFNQLSEVNLTPLQHGTQPERLDLYSNQLTEVDLTPLQYCQQLTYLELWMNQLDEVDLTPLQHCPRLDTLYLDDEVSIVAAESLRSASLPAGIKDHHRRRIIWR